MEECVIHTELAVVSDDQSPEVSQPGKGPFDFPSTPVAMEHAAVVEGKPLLIKGPHPRYSVYETKPHS
jgi:hypothetical protein